MKRLRTLAIVIAMLGSCSSFAAGDKSMNLMVSPLGLIIGIANMGLDFKVNEQWTLGPQLAVVSAKWGDVEVTGVGAGIRGDYYFQNGVFADGWYFGPSLSFSSVKASAKSSVTGNTLSTKASAVVVTALAGYHWFWDTFNMNLGGGASLSSHGNSLEIKDETTGETDSVSIRAGGAGLALEWNIGWTF